MGAMASQITSLAIVYSVIYSGTDQRKHQSSPLLAFVRGIHRWPVNSPHKGPVTRKMFPLNDVIIQTVCWNRHWHMWPYNPGMLYMWATPVAICVCTDICWYSLLAAISAIILSAYLWNTNSVIPAALASTDNEGCGDDNRSPLVTINLVVTNMAHTDEMWIPLWVCLINSAVLTRVPTQLP